MDYGVVDAEVKRALDELERRLGELALRLDRMDRNGLDTLLFRNLFGGSGGLYGTDQQAARTDHSH